MKLSVRTLLVGLLLIAAAAAKPAHRYEESTGGKHSKREFYGKRDKATSERTRRSAHHEELPEQPTEYFDQEEAYPNSVAAEPRAGAHQRPLNLDYFYEPRRGGRNRRQAMEEASGSENQSYKKDGESKGKRESGPVEMRETTYIPELLVDAVSNVHFPSGSPGHGATPRYREPRDFTLIEGSDSALAQRIAEILRDERQLQSADKAVKEQMMQGNVEHPGRGRITDKVAQVLQEHRRQERPGKTAQEQMMQGNSELSKPSDIPTSTLSLGDKIAQIAVELKARNLSIAEATGKIPRLPESASDKQKTPLADKLAQILMELRDRNAAEEAERRRKHSEFAEISETQQTGIALAHTLAEILIELRVRNSLWLASLRRRSKNTGIAEKALGENPRDDAGGIQGEQVLTVPNVDTLEELQRVLAQYEQYEQYKRNQ